MDAQLVGWYLYGLVVTLFALFTAYTDDDGDTLFVETFVACLLVASIWPIIVPSIILRYFTRRA